MTTTTINRMVATESAGKKKARSNKYVFFLVNSEPAFVARSLHGKSSNTRNRESWRDLLARFGQGRTYKCRNLESWRKVFESSAAESTWISTTTEKTEELLRAASSFLASHHGTKRVLGDLLMLQSPRVESLPALRTLFRNVVGEVSAYERLPPEELAEVLRAPKDESRDLIIGGSYDPATETFTLTRGNLETVVVPLSLFRPSGKATPDPTHLAVTDYGHTVKLGKYEASADAILYEVDPDYRRRLNAKRRQEEKGFGASLRRFRIQRHISRNDFPGLSAKTIARIERGETGKPHGNTLNILVKTLGVQPDEIETY